MMGIVGLVIMEVTWRGSGGSGRNMIETSMVDDKREGRLDDDDGRDSREYSCGEIVVASSWQGKAAGVVVGRRSR